MRRKTLTLATSIAILAFILFACKESGGSTFTDPRDKKTYKTVKIGEQVWMAENLNYNADGSKCYENQESNCQKYGRLYNWSTAKTACPSGWHLPSDEEWQVLVDLAANNGEKAENMLKASNGWNENGNGVDAIGFSALPGGVCDSSGVFRSISKFGYWWGSTESNVSRAIYRGMSYIREGVRRSEVDKTNLYSVRCVQD
jgi:uncharacterized protein (TIGR02145 family)